MILKPCQYATNKYVSECSDSIISLLVTWKQSPCNASMISISSVKIVFFLLKMCNFPVIRFVLRSSFSCKNPKNYHKNEQQMRPEYEFSHRSHMIWVKWYESNETLIGLLFTIWPLCCRMEASKMFKKVFFLIFLVFLIVQAVAFFNKPSKDSSDCHFNQPFFNPLTIAPQIKIISTHFQVLKFISNFDS